MCTGTHVALRGLRGYGRGRGSPPRMAPRVLQQLVAPQIVDASSCSVPPTRQPDPLTACVDVVAKGKVLSLPSWVRYRPTLYTLPILRHPRRAAAAIHACSMCALQLTHNHPCHNSVAPKQLRVV